MSKLKQAISPIIKEKLGFKRSMPDKEFLKVWKEQSTRVCKPCWELKYCPYGPLVEQSPLLPPKLQSAVEHNEYLKKCLETNIYGMEVKISPTRIKYFKKRVREEKGKLINNNLSKNEKSQIRLEIMKMEKIIKTGIEDHRKPLDFDRRKYFEIQVSEFNPKDYPEFIPKAISEMECNVFGHICPVVFSAEFFTETSKERMIGRYISFKTKMRVVRRDNYTCQVCFCNLKDDQVEFDHVIPISKGGSSEEHNIRLTCYNCNRDKLDKVQI